MLIKLQIIFLIIVFLQVISGTTTFKDVTSDFPPAPNALLTAFGDINADRYVDLFFGSARNVSVLYSSPYMNQLSFKLRTLFQIGEGEEIVNVAPGDFNGDSFLDLLVCSRLLNKPVNSTSSIAMTIYYQNSHANKPNFQNHFRIAQLVRDQPLVFDYNGDMMPDIIGEIEPGHTFYWISHKNDTFTSHEFESSNKTLVWKSPSAASFVDINGDFNADLLIPVVNPVDNTVYLKVCFKQGSTFDLCELISLPSEINKAEYVGQVGFADLQANGRMDIILPACLNPPSCSDSRIYVYVYEDYKNKQWHEVLSKFDNGNLGFSPHPDDQLLPVTLRYSDYDLDGHQDAIVILRTISGGSTNSSRPYLLRNVACDAKNCTDFGRKFELVNNSKLYSYENAVLSAFYDIRDTGIPSVVLVTKSSGVMNFHALQNVFDTEAYFLKIMVLSGLCYTKCANGELPYGNDQPGPVVYYETTDLEGNLIHSVHQQMSQSQHYSLQLPYAIFGLGNNPNYVTKVKVGIPNNLRQTQANTWQYFIPNSQVFIIPYPSYDSHNWVKQMFVRPSELFIYTAIALGGICVFLGLIIAGYQYFELREDKKEKQEQSHQFHFDAM